VIELLEQPEPGPWRTVVGMIADFLTVKHEYAALIDLALGDWAQRFVVRDMAQLLQALGQHGQPFSGRVSFLPLQSGADDPVLQSLRGNRLVQVSLLSRVRQPGEPSPAPEHPGLVASAAQLVSCDHPELADLPAQLLGRTLIVRDLATARNLAAHASGFRLVTLQGELLEPDGTLTIGTHHAEMGILSRKSELRELCEQRSRLDERIAETEHDLQALREEMQALEEREQEQREEIDVLKEQANDLRTRVQLHRKQRQGFHEEVTVSASEIQRLEQEIARLEAAWQEARAQAAEAEARVHQLQNRCHQAEDEIRHADKTQQQQQQEYTQAKVTLTKVEERLSRLEAEHRKFVYDHQLCQKEWQQSQQSLVAGQARLTESQLTTLRAEQVLARAYLDKEAFQCRVAAMAAQREAKRQERARLTQQAQTMRDEWRKHQEKMHQRELKAAELRQTRDTLVQRLQEDYQLDLAQLYQQPRAEENAQEGQPPHTPVALNPVEAEQEIEELRRKLHRLGSVNLDSLQELQELETRATSLQAQFDDLTSAKKSLEEIIGKINQDSRRLFVETFEAIRAHFQELFRKVFGGGMADILLEDEADVLESGIEINARPPGKELRSISLMSGGEKTLTAVALLLAIFRSKPSPFCLLDEVDAALDEANIGRFTAVLREFLDRSQFIIVTHSKKTMAAADVLYGITMQESGISKQVTIRFEDWVEDEPPATEVA
jgi:chromosome segregation protein